MTKPHRIFIGGIVAIAVILIGWQLFTMANRDKFFKLYMHRLDTWVNTGGDATKVQLDVVENCGKLMIMTQSNVLETISFLTFDQKDLDFRIDVCTKMTVHRVWPQPEFEDPKVVEMVCESNTFEALCRRSGLVPLSPPS
jgi:hypothetical protein